MVKPRKNEKSGKIKVLFVAGFGPVTRNRDKSKRLYGDALAIAFKEEEGGYLHTDSVEGVKHFAVWPLEQAAQSCFGSTIWPRGVPVPQAWLEFDVEDIESASAELRRRGFKLLVAARKEPWGQVVTRMISPEGLLLGVTFTPSMRHK